MNKILSFFLICACFLSVKAQTKTTESVKLQAAPISFKETQPFGVVDKQDLELKDCDFEKGANAEVLFDKGNIVQDGDSFYMERHTRTKIFTEAGKNYGTVELEYTSYLSSSVINDLEAETINPVNDKPEITKLDKKTEYTRNIDKFRSVLAFAMPNVKAGSIIEYKYRVALVAGYFTNWFFQQRIPTRYSEIKTNFTSADTYRIIPHVKQPYAKDIGTIDDYTQIKALINIRAMPTEPYIGAIEDNLQRIEFLNRRTMFDSWQKMGEYGVKAVDFGLQFPRNVDGEGEIIKHAKSLKSDEEKIAFLFDTVRNRMKWNNIHLFYTIDGTVRAWDRKVGNSAEINIILYHLLKRAGINAYPMTVSTKSNGKLNPLNPNIYIFNSAVVYVPVDSTKNYVLDASGKYNLFNEIPIDELNTFGLDFDEDNKDYSTVFLQNTSPAIEQAFINAEIKPNGKMTGSAEINSHGYHKMDAVEKYKTDGEEKYIKFLGNNDNNIKITSLKLENMDVDSLPLTQKINFDVDLAGSDENYIYFSANLFNLMGDNPFKSEDRFSDIDFGYRNNFAFNTIYKLPAGYKTDALPKSVTIVMPDESIVFKRIVAEDDGTLLVKFTLDHKKTIYFREDYQDIRSFYKKMYELLNEQVVLKKG